MLGGEVVPEAAFTFTPRRRLLLGPKNCAMGRPALALLALLAIFSGADAKKTKKLSAAEREERRAKGELLMNAVNLGDREEVERLREEDAAWSGSGGSAVHSGQVHAHAEKRQHQHGDGGRILRLTREGEVFTAAPQPCSAAARLPAQGTRHCQSRPVASPRDDIISSLWCMPELARALTRP